MKTIKSVPDRQTIRYNHKSLYPGPIEAMCEPIENAIDYRIPNQPGAKVFTIFEENRNIVADNGLGMTVAELFDALAIKRREQCNGSSGAYGTGLKSSLDYLCETRIVISQKEGKLCWSHYDNEGWDITVYEDGDKGTKAAELLWKEHSVDPAENGTIIIMDNLRHENPKCKILVEKLKYKYHYKLQNKNVEFFINGDRLQTQDPYAKTFLGHKKIKGQPAQGFEFLDKMQKDYVCSETGITLPLTHSFSIGPSGTGTHYARACVVRLGVLIAARQHYGIANLNSQQTQMHRAQVLIEYGGTPEQVRLGDELFGVNHTKAASGNKTLDKPFLDFLNNIYGDAIAYQKNKSNSDDSDEQLDNRWKSVFKKTAQTISFKMPKIVKVEKKEQKTSDEPDPRSPKEEGKGSHSRGTTDKVITDDWRGKYNLKYCDLSHNAPYDYELDGPQIVVLFNTSVPHIRSARIETNNSRDYADEIPATVQQMFFAAARQAVNRERGMMNEDDWSSHLDNYEKLSSEEDLEVFETELLKKVV